MSPVDARCSSLRSFKTSSPERCISLVTPGGFDRYSTGSPALRNTTPPYVDGRKPLDQIEVPPLVPTPDPSTTNPGKFCDSLPSPYSTHAPMVGRPTWMLPPN